ncbi:AraC family transcriptional regulator [Mucilaginibacter terrenus]|uniref:AraC family transcriptional regulator n=1 Tax=Mucilaginibacter terrenus TaxID=2482727 RepID=A0A3E2NR75_9SPHI|nr:AraC family transcriptional regulator [Mucilaginibacter terrenus]RFZ83492.1 AraC family transcriptional regulator [Mucilaginibacter terrenus]
MKTYYLPDDILDGQKADDASVVVRYYTSGNNSIKNKIALNQNMINLLISGTKTIVYPEETAILNEGQLVLLSTGNVLTSELISGTAGFSSILLYFSNDVFNRFLIKYEHLAKGAGTKAEKHPFVIFEQDAFIRQYISSLQALSNTKNVIPPAIALLKLEELLLYLLHAQPDRLLSLHVLSQDREELQLKKVVESHVGHLITVDELAFLCNMSTSTFKRRFGEIYNTTPQKWLQAKKLEMAAELLRLPAESPSAVYIKVGYQNHSSFSQAFRQHYGCTPSNYRTERLNVIP